MLTLTTGVLCCAGMDAQVSYAFHKNREKHPERFKNQLLNQVPTTDPLSLV